MTRDSLITHRIMTRVKYYSPDETRKRKWADENIRIDEMMFAALSNSRKKNETLRRTA